MPVLQLGLDISKLRSGAAQASAALEDVSKSAQRVEKDTANMGSSFASAARSILAVVGAYKALEGMKGFVQRGVEFNSSMEQSRIGIAAIVTTMVKLQDEQGRVLEGVEKYAAAQSVAADIMAQIQQLGLETTATTQELVQGFQSVMGSALNAGLTLEQIPRFAVAGAQAMQTLGIPLEQMRTELDALLTGRIDGGDDLLAPRLGLDRATIKSWREQGVLFDRLMERLSAFEIAGKDVAQTWKGLVSNFSEAMDVLAGQSAESLSESLKDAVRALQDMIIVTGDGAPRISDNFRQIADVINGLESALGETILTLTHDFVDAVQSVNNAIEEMGGSEALFGRMETAISTVGAALASVAVLRRTGAVDAIRASQEQTAALVQEQKATQSLAQTERDAAQTARDLAARENETAQAAVQAARSNLQMAQSQVEAARSKKQSTYASTRLQNALRAEATARYNLTQAQREARSTAAALSAANNVLAHSEQRLATVTQQAATATSLHARGLSTAQGIWTAACSAMTAAAGRLASGLKALWAGLGGGIGVAITALTTGLVYLSTRQNDAARAAELHTRAQENFKKALQESTDETGKQTRALSALEKQRLAVSRAEEEKAYQLQLKQTTQELENMLARIETSRQIFLENNMEGFAIPESFVESLQDLLDAFDSGKVKADQLQQGLAQLRQKAVDAGYGTSDFVKALDGINQQDGALDKLVQYARALGLITEQANAAGSAVRAMGNAVNQGIQGLEEALKTSQFDVYVAGLNKVQQAQAKGLKDMKLNHKQVQEILSGDLSSVPEKDRPNLQSYLKNIEQLTSLKTTSGGGSGGASAIASAQKSIADLRREMAQMRGEATQTGNELSKKFSEIAETGQKAGMSAGQITALQKEYREAFQAQTLKDFDKELLSVQGNTKALRDLEIADKMKEWRAQFEAAGISASEAEPKLREMQAALEKQQNLQDLQSAIGFYQELGELSGNYGLSIERQNELIKAQGEAYRQAGISDELVKQWEILKQLENARDPFSGILRSTQQYFASATDYASQIGDIWTDTMDGMADALTNFVTSGKLDFQDLANEFIKQVIRMQMQAMVSGLFKGIGSIVTGFFGDSAAMEEEALLRGQYAKGGVIAGGTLSRYSGTIVDTPTLFTGGTRIPAYASGVGLMGEAGPEAILPLTRSSNGRLGVEAVGGAGGVNVPINIEVYNETGTNSTVETSQRRNSEGGMDVSVFIKRIVTQDISQGNGGMIANTLQATYGLKRQQRGR